MAEESVLRHSVKGISGVFSMSPSCSQVQEATLATECWRSCWRLDLGIPSGASMWDCQFQVIPNSESGEKSEPVTNRKISPLPLAEKFGP